MKKGLIIGLAVLMILGLAITVALADGSTDAKWDFTGSGHFGGSVTGPNGDPAAYVNMNWNGSGELWAKVVAGDDAKTFFRTGGYHIEGNFDCVDDNTNYLGVDYFTTYMTASVDGGGYIGHYTERLDSSTTAHPKTGGTTPTGQYSRSWVLTSDYGYLTNERLTSYWALYEFGTTLSASGNFYVKHEIDVEGDGGYVSCGGSGSVTIVSPRNVVAGGDGGFFGQGFQLGHEGMQWGDPWLLYEVESSAVGTGEGLFQVEAWHDSYLRSDAFGYELPGGGSAYFVLEYDDGFTQGSFATYGSTGSAY